MHIQWQANMNDIKGNLVDMWIIKKSPMWHNPILMVDKMKAITYFKYSTDGWGLIIQNKLKFWVKYT